MRQINNTNENNQNVLNIASTSAEMNVAQLKSGPRIVFENCTFNVENFNCNDAI